MTAPTLFATMSFADADAAITRLTALGFVERAVYRDDAGLVVHADFGWGAAGALMFGQSMPRAGREDWLDLTGVGSAYCVVPTDVDVDAVHERGLAAGMTSVQPPTDMDYGGRGATLRDPEGNQFSFGSYAGD